MGLERITSKGTAPRAGRVLGAQMLVRGAVTEFQQQKSGGGLGVGIPIRNFGTIKLGGDVSTGHVALDVRLIDTTTGEVIQSHRAESKTSSTEFAGSITSSRFAFGGDTFNRTPLGLATRQAIWKAVRFIVVAMEPIPWEGKVTDVEPNKVYINAGAEDNIYRGEVFQIVRTTKRIVDPDTNLVLGTVDEPIGRVQVDRVWPKFSTAAIMGEFEPAKGDRVRWQLTSTGGL